MRGAKLQPKSECRRRSKKYSSKESLFSHRAISTLKIALKGTYRAQRGFDTPPHALSLSKAIDTPITAQSIEAARSK